MAKATFELDVIIDDPNKPVEDQYGLALALNSGQGPLEFTIKPNPKFRFTLKDVLNQLDQLLNLNVLSKIGDLTTNPPWEYIFSGVLDWAYEPSLVVKVDKSASSIQLQIDLYESVDSDTLGVNLNPPDLAKYHIDIEPNITVYSLMAGYTTEKGFDVSAKVKFHDQTGSDTQTLTASSSDDDSGKPSVVKFPFPTPSPKLPLFKLNYIGLGQRFGPPLPQDTNDFANALSTIFTELEKTFTSNDPEYLLTNLVQEYYQPDRGWFFGLHIDIKGWDLKVLFNDPVLYGLEISVGEGGGQFAGLDLIILYEKLGPHLGVYYGKLTIPEAYRTIELGAVSLTLPTVQIWIYTNGDFKVNVGWPLGPESIGIQVYIFTGSCGFYFGKLRSGDNPQNPNPPVVYNPILEFGLGLSVGLGRSFQSGPFSASLSLTLQGTFQGVLAWEEDKGDITHTPDYYWFAATVSLVGTLQGEVDLKIITLSVMVKMSVTAGIAFETDYGTVVAVIAKVEAKASVKVLFVKITVSFSATISETFTLSTGPNGNASLDGPQNPSFAGMNGGGSSSPKPLTIEKPMTYATRAPLATVETPVTFPLNFMLYPSVVYDTTSDNGPKAVAVLSFDVPETPDSSWPWEMLLTAYSSWLLNTYSNGTDWDPVTVALSPEAVGTSNFDTNVVNEFLAKQVVFSISGIDFSQAGDDPDEQQVALFPILPNLQLSYEDGTKNVSFDEPIVSSSYISILEDYLSQFSINDLTSNPDSGSGTMAAKAEDDSIPLNGQMLIDYFLTIGRQLAQQMPDSTVADIAPNLAGMVSRFLLNGLIIPNPTDPNNVEDYQGLYHLTGQQFAVDDSKDSVEATLAKNAISTPATGQPDFSQMVVDFGADDNASSTLPVEPPPSDPPTFPASPIALPALSSNALWVSARTKLAWNSDHLIVPLPNQILTALKSQTLSLSIQNEFPNEDTTQATIATAIPGLLIPITITQVAKSQSFNVDEDGAALPGFLPYLYQISSTNDETRQRIEDALNGADLSTAEITLLYDNTSGSNGYQSDLQNPTNTLLLKTNLSTSSEPDSINAPLLLATEQSQNNLGPVVALQNQVANFLQIIWENSVVNANGFFLYYENGNQGDFPSTLFSGSQADLNILVSFPKATTFQSWHNVLTTDEQDSNQPLYIGVADAQGNALPSFHPTYPAGCLAFEITLPDEATLLTAEGDNQPYSADTVEQLYHLIQYQIAQGSSGSSGPSFDASGWAPAVTPSAQSSGGSDGSGGSSTTSSSSNQSYRQVVPAYKFLPDNADAPLVTGGLPFTYAAIGGFPEMEFRLCDLYGNVLNANTKLAQKEILYNDLLVSLAEWPGVQVAYRIYIDSNQDKVLALQIEFNPNQVLRNMANYAVHGLAAGEDPQEGDDIRQQAQVALFQMYTVINQVSDPNTAFDVTATIFQTASNSSGTISSGDQLRTPLKSLAANIITDLQKVYADPSQAGSLSQIDTTINISIDPTQIALIDTDILALTVSMGMSRPSDLLAPDADTLLPKVADNTFVVKPNLEQQTTAAKADDSTDPVTLTQWAEDFEAVFQGFDGADGQVKVATRTGNPDFSSTGSNAYLWTVKWSKSKGIALSFTSDQFNYFTLAPLSTQLLPSVPVSLTTYNENLTPTTTLTAFTNVDVDAAAQTFLRTIDELLSPESAAAISKVDPSGFDTLLQYKSELATAIQNGLIPVFENEDGDLESAMDRFEQALLTELSNAYNTSAVVQTAGQVTVNGTPESGSTESPRLFGGISAPESSLSAGSNGTDLEQEYSLSNGKFELGASGGQTASEYLNFLATAKHPAQQADISVELAYSPVFLEHLIEQSEEEYGYVPSSWLRFVITGPGTPSYYDLGEANIPIPLRSFPQNPSLQGQSASADAADELGLVASSNPVEDALKWEYTVNLIKSEAAAQDELWFDLVYNSPVQNLDAATALRADSTTKLTNLFTSLAQFNAAYDSLKSELSTNIDQVFEAPPKDPGQLTQIVTTLNQSIDQVVSDWQAFYEPDLAEAASDGPAVITEHFALSFKDMSDGILTLYSDVNDDFPATINGQAAQNVPTTVSDAEMPGTGLQYSVQYPYEKNEDGALTIVWKDINAIERQTAITTFWIIRNADLGSASETAPVNEKLIYQSPEVSFANPVLPLLTVPFVQADTATSLSQTISDAFQPFAEAGTASTQNRLMKVECTYTFNLVNFMGNNIVNALTVPIVTKLVYDLNLLPNDATDTTDASTLQDFSCCLANDLTDWFNANKPTNMPDNVQANLHFNAMLFAVIDGSQLPLIKVQDIQVTVPGQGWWTKVCD
ncbi:MAG: hypothetical protein DHS20C18_40400 [Saprospiraceae bacterium]|nr:MAG: hypothetical protein DHS20C18_40400 [Saprospiraceae bacterium]